MRLLVVLMAWFLRRRLDLLQRLDPDRTWRQVMQRLTPLARFGTDTVPWALWILLTLAVALTAVLAAALSQSVGGWAAGALALALLLTMTGLTGWRGPLMAYGQAWQRGDMQGAWHHVQHLLPAEARGAALSPDRLHLTLAETLLGATFERYFLPIFWYVLLGPAGVVLATGSLAFRNHYPEQSVRASFAGLCDLLAWLPRRLLSFTFGVAGDFNGWAREKHAIGAARSSSEALLLAASGALSSYALDPRQFERYHPEAWRDFGDRSMHAVRDLINRSMLVWLGIIALFAIFGWVR
ncbi:histidine kinase [Marinobacteraceae bacterium S3BR75-40.1]